MIQRLTRSLTTWPSLRGWVEAFLIAGAGLFLVAMITHGLAVFAWQVFLGGPDVKALL